MFKAAPFDIVLAVSIFVAKAFERVLFKTLVDRIRPYSYGFGLVLLFVYATVSVIAFVIQQLAFKFCYKTSQQPLESFPKLHCLGVAFLDFVIFQSLFVSGSFVPAALTVTLLQAFLPFSIIFTLPCGSCLRYSWGHHLCALLVVFGILLNVMPYLMGSAPFLDDANDRILRNIYVYISASALGFLSGIYKNFLFRTRYVRVLQFNAWNISMQFVVALILSPAGISLQFFDEVGPRTSHDSVFGEVIYNLQYMLQCLGGMRAYVYDNALPNATDTCSDAAAVAFGFVLCALAADWISLLLLKRRKPVPLHVALALAMLPAFTILQLTELPHPPDGISDEEVVQMPSWQHQIFAFTGLLLVSGSSIAFALLPQGKLKQIKTPLPFEEEVN